MSAAPAPAPRPDRPHLRRMEEGPPRAEERLRAVHDIREKVANLPRSPFYEAAKEAVNAIDLAERFAKSPLLKWTVMDFFGIDDKVFDASKANIEEEVTQALTEGEVPQVRTLWNWCVKYQKTYDELMDKIRRAFEAYKKGAGRERDTAAKRREELESKVAAAKKAKAFIQQGAFERTLSGFVGHPLNADTVLNASAEYVELCAGKVEPGKRSTRVLFDLVKRYYNQRFGRSMDDVQTMTQLKVWLVKLHRARDAFGEPVKTPFDQMGASEPTPFDDLETIEVPEQKRLIEFLDSFSMSQRTNKILDQFLEGRKINFGNRMAALEDFCQFLLTGDKNAYNLQELQEKGVDIPRLVKALATAFKEYQKDPAAYDVSKKEAAAA